MSTDPVNMLTQRWRMEGRRPDWMKNVVMYYRVTVAEELVAFHGLPPQVGPLSRPFPISTVAVNCVS